MRGYQIVQIAILGLVLLPALTGCNWIQPELVACNSETSDRCERFAGYSCDLSAGFCGLTDLDETEPSLEEEGAESRDSDNDGLSNAFEDLIGTNPDASDSDGDGWTDTYEHLTFFRATDHDDFPYEGRYPRGPLMTAVDWNLHKKKYNERRGWGPQDMPPDGSDGGLYDQYGEQIQLHKFFGNVIVIQATAQWCEPCANAANAAEDGFRNRRERGMVFLHYLLEGDSWNENAVPSPSEWASEHNLTLPVLNAVKDPIRTELPVDYFPSYVVLNRWMEVDTALTGGGELDESFWENIDELLEDDPPAVDWPLPENASELYEALGTEEGSWIHSGPAPS